jgi:MftR C-terminal domain
MITESPALRARERAIFDRYTDSLAETIAAEIGSPGDLEPWVVANALMGVHRASIDYSRQRLLAGADSARVSREMRARIKRALDTLETGFGTLGVRSER